MRIKAKKACARDAPFVYICSPYSGDTRGNTERAKGYCRAALADGVIPIAPHLYIPGFVSEGDERQLALSIGLRLLGICREVWVFGEPTAGMAGEIREAERLGIPVIRRNSKSSVCSKSGCREEENQYVRD